MIAKVQRTRMSPDGFYPAVAFNRRIPKLARTGKFGRSGFFFHRARRILFRQDEKECGYIPHLETSQSSLKIYLQSVAFLLNYTLRIKKKPQF